MNSTLLDFPKNWDIIALMADSIHPVQLAILKELLFRPSARFSDLNVAGLTSDHFTFHVHHLVSQGLVSKKGTAYMLTTVGKEYANRIDTENSQIERQGKISIKPVIIKLKVGGPCC